MNELEINTLIFTYYLNSLFMSKSFPLVSCNADETSQRNPHMDIVNRTQHAVMKYVCLFSAMHSNRTSYNIPEVTSNNF